MLQKLQKFVKVAHKTESCPKVAEKFVDRANQLNGQYPTKRNIKASYESRWLVVNRMIAYFV